MQRMRPLQLAVTPEAARNSVACPFFMPEQRLRIRLAFSAAACRWRPDGPALVLLPARTARALATMSLSRGAIWDMRRTVAACPPIATPMRCASSWAKSATVFCTCALPASLRTCRRPTASCCTKRRSATWPQKHEDARIQRMAECYVQVQLERRAQPKP